MPYKIFTSHKDFFLESGEVLPAIRLAYTTQGKLNEDKSNVVWVFHALTANSDAQEWWPGLVGEGKLFDPLKHFIICVNMPGSCYGSISPIDINPLTGSHYYHSFPLFTTRDMIRAYKTLRDHLEIKSVLIGIGGSMGGQQLLEWAIDEPGFFRHIVPIATNAFHSPWGIAFNASQRLCIETDTTWSNNHENAGLQGMKAARSIALLSYRHYITYNNTQAEEDPNKLDHFKSESYQRYQGEKLAKRFNAYSYFFLSKSMDAHNVGRGRTSAQLALQKIKAKTLVIGIDSDILFPLQEQQFCADHIPGAVFHAIHSLYGHDGFLLEFEIIHSLINSFLEETTIDLQKLSARNSAG